MPLKDYYIVDHNKKDLKKKICSSAIGDLYMFFSVMSRSIHPGRSSTVPRPSDILLLPSAPPTFFIEKRGWAKNLAALRRPSISKAVIVLLLYCSYSVFGRLDPRLLLNPKQQQLIWRLYRHSSTWRVNRSREYNNEKAWELLDVLYILFLRSYHYIYSI